MHKYRLGAAIDVNTASGILDRVNHFLSLERVDARQLVIVLIISVFLDTILVKRDGLAEEFNPLSAITLVLTLV